MKKLGIKGEMKLMLINAPENYSELLEHDINAQLTNKISEADFVHLFVVSGKELESNFPQHEFELLFVNDGSKDNSFKELLELKEKTGDGRLKIISFSKNFGQMAAILAGWCAVVGSFPVPEKARL